MRAPSVGENEPAAPNGTAGFALPLQASFTEGGGGSAIPA